MLDYLQNPLYAKEVLKSSAIRLEKLRERRDSLRKGICPALPEGNYPMKIKPVDARNPPSAPPAYLLSINTGHAARTKHEIYVRLDAGQKKFEDDLGLVINKGILELRKQHENSFFNRRYYEKEIKKELEKDFARLYPVTPEIAEKIHLFDCARSENDLKIVPKENIFEAEKLGWQRDSMDDVDNLLGLAALAVEDLKKAGWNVPLIKYHKTADNSDILDVDKILKEVYSLQKRLERYNDKKSFNEGNYEYGN